jgi:FkbM family methyltransferase
VSARHTAAERLKLGLRRVLLRADLDLGRDAFVRRVARTLADREIDTVLDIGANEGQYAALVRAAGFPGRIISVEPLPDAFGRLQRRSRTDRRWVVDRRAVGAEIGRTTIRVSANSYSSSVLPLTPAHLLAAPESRVVESIEVDVTTVVALAEAYQLVPERTLVKIDTQGFEGAVLDGAGDWLDRVAAVQLEVSHVELYTGQALEPELSARMAGHGLVPWTNDPGISAADGRLLQSDVLFVRA